MVKNTQPVNVLLIEDNPDDISLMKEAFKEEKISFNISVVTDGMEPIKDLTKVEDYENTVTSDLILLDFNLSKKNGKKVLRDIKSTPNLRHIPIIALTTSNAEQAILHSYSLHTNFYINKSVDFDSSFYAIQKIENFEGIQSYYLQ